MTKLLSALLVSGFAFQFAQAAPVKVIDNAKGQMMGLCGAVKKTKMAARLAADPVDFYLQSTNTTNQKFLGGDFWGSASDISNYWSPWGEDTNTEVTMCFYVLHHSDSTWTVAGYNRTGESTSLKLTIWGRPVDHLGQPVETVGNAVIDSSDIASLNYLNIYQGVNATDSAVMANGMAAHFGERAVPGTLALSYDVNGYPVSFSSSTAAGPYVSFNVGATHDISCANTEASPVPALWGTCIQWGYYATGTLHEDDGSRVVSPTSVGRKLYSVEYAHDGARWIKYDPSLDSYTVSDPGLAALLTEVEFRPFYWALFNDNENDFHEPTPL